MATKSPDLNRIKADIRRQLQSHGTDVVLNENDPTGDGDQSPIQLDNDGKQVYRDLFSAGGDLAEHAETGELSKFMQDCIEGNVAPVASKLKWASGNNNGVSSKPPKKLVKLLETRETSMRLSPLLAVVAMGKNLMPQTPTLWRNQIQVVSLLLKYGARPDAKDVCGKTVCHYGAGCMATKTTMRMVELCIEAHQSSFMLGKEVELFGLKNQRMNGKHGIAHGFDTETKRRAIHLLYEEKQVAVKPENIRLYGKAKPSFQPALCDIQDRLGAVSLVEVMAQGRDEVAEFLIDKHNARVDIEDSDGCSPKSMAMAPGAELVSRGVATRIKQRVARDAKDVKRRCANCGKAQPEGVYFDACARCQSVLYCSRTCQIFHWKEGGHKVVCKKAAKEREQAIPLETPRQLGYSAVISNRSMATSSDGSYRKPDHVAVGERFYVKVQASGATVPLMVYDKTRQCSFSYFPDQSGFEAVRTKVSQEPAFNGRKTYMKASFDESGSCTLYPGSSTALKKW